MRISWTTYSLNPSRLTPAEFVYARSSPRTFRRAQWMRLLPTIGGAAARVVAVLVLAAFVGSIDNPNFFLGLLGFAALGVIVSFSLSTLSFLLFLVRFGFFWRRVTRMAARSLSADELNRRVFGSEMARGAPELTAVDQALERHVRDTRSERLATMVHDHTLAPDARERARRELQRRETTLIGARRT